MKEFYFLKKKQMIPVRQNKTKQNKKHTGSLFCVSQLLLCVRDLPLSMVYTPGDTIGKCCSLFPFSGGINCTKVRGVVSTFPSPSGILCGLNLNMSGEAVTVSVSSCLYIRLLLDNAASLESPTTYTLRQKCETAITLGLTPCGILKDIKRLTTFHHPDK